MKRLISCLPHITISLALFLITCFTVDRFNRAMAFINNDFTKITLMIFALLVIVESVIFTIRERSAKRKGQENPSQTTSSK